MAECVRLSLVDIDFGWSSHRETTKVDWFWRSHEESVVCNPAHLSLCFSLSLSPSPALGPGTEACLRKVMEIRLNVVLLWR